ncbi:hypothetical protein F4821DRAFT_62357 [Hypoxylon rubiginosum]|uniref:Uncharacterized protein n=1 Tax=Hypoxylon rubiginosum TaxID=110542 RepID=A0ACC0D9N7_9PEZI|nr:hypothetical protein F4821DRAFT_62357 [Hypoxylon rubiginosum]
MARISRDHSAAPSAIPSAVTRCHRRRVFLIISWLALTMAGHRLDSRCRHNFSRRPTHTFDQPPVLDTFLPTPKISRSDWQRSSKALGRSKRSRRYNQVWIRQVSIDRVSLSINCHTRYKNSQSCHLGDDAGYKRVSPSKRLLELVCEPG